MEKAAGVGVREGGRIGGVWTTTDKPVRQSQNRSEKCLRNVRQEGNASPQLLRGLFQPKPSKTGSRLSGKCGQGTSESPLDSNSEDL